MSSLDTTSLKTACGQIWYGLIDYILESYNLILSGAIGAVLSNAISNGGITEEYMSQVFIFVIFGLALKKLIKLFHPDHYKKDTHKQLEEIKSKIDSVIDDE